MTDESDQRWQHLMEPNMGFVNVGSSVYGSSSLFHQDYEQPLINALPYSNYPAPEMEAPAGFIDAWSLNNLESNSNGNAESSSITRNGGNLSPSLNLSIAMAAGNIADQEMGNFDEQGGKDPRWISPLFWEPFSQGGPLAEALKPGSVVSSPTGVLHRTLFSHSDGSGCSSPAPAAAPSSEIAFHRLN